MSSLSHRPVDADVFAMGEGTILHADLDAFFASVDHHVVPR